MKCTSKAMAMAMAVATATMKKMTEAEYTLFAPFDGGSTWHVARVDEKATYRV
jgi:hypothetical protein